MKPRRESLVGVVGVAVTAAVLIAPGIPRSCAQKAAAGAKSERPLFPRRPSVKGMKLKVSPSGRYFVDQDGKPFFYLGDTCWLLFQRLNRQELDDYLKDRAGKGFTVIQAYVL